MGGSCAPGVSGCFSCIIGEILRKLHSASATRAWAAVAKESYAYELGVDSPEVEEAERVLSDPTAHPAWGTRQRLAVGDTRGVVANMALGA